MGNKLRLNLLVSTQRAAALLPRHCCSWCSYVCTCGLHEYCRFHGCQRPIFIRRGFLCATQRDTRHNSDTLRDKFRTSCVVSVCQAVVVALGKSLVSNYKNIICLQQHTMTMLLVVKQLHQTRNHNYCNWSVVIMIIHNFIIMVCTATLHIQVQKKRG